LQLIGNSVPHGGADEAAALLGQLETLVYLVMNKAIWRRKVFLSQISAKYIVTDFTQHLNGKSLNSRISDMHGVGEG
jgi:hypothetical protein